MTLVESLGQLAQQNMSGMAFLATFGVTWLVCGLFWQRSTERVAALVTLFQGVVATPAALGLSALIGAIGQDRPVPDEITQLAILIGASQLLGLPLLIYLVVRQNYTLVPFAFAAITSMHFVMYSWLYQTPIYVVMAVLISLGAATVMFTAPESRSSSGPVRVCCLTGGLLAATAVVFVLMHFIGG